MSLVSRSCPTCAAPLVGVEPCEPPIHLKNGHSILWCTLQCEAPRPHRWTVLVDVDGAGDEAVVLVPEQKHRRAKDELAYRGIVRNVVGLQELVVRIARIQLALLGAMARPDEPGRFATDHAAAALVDQVEALRPLIDAVAESGAALRRSLDAQSDE